jgi:hypothetical protein
VILSEIQEQTKVPAPIHGAGTLNRFCKHLLNLSDGGFIELSREGSF